MRASSQQRVPTSASARSWPQRRRKPRRMRRSRRAARGYGCCRRRMSSRSAERGLRIGDTVCLYVNGEPALGKALFSLPAGSVKTVKLYADSVQLIDKLADRWPKQARCGRSQSSRSGRTWPLRRGRRVRDRIGRAMRLQRTVLTRAPFFSDAPAVSGTAAGRWGCDGRPVTSSANVPVSPFGLAEARTHARICGPAS